jgi:hypothetical protein
MANKVQANQTGAQTGGVIFSGKSKGSTSVNSGDQRRMGGADIASVTGNVSVVEGIPADSFTSLVGNLFQAKDSAVSAATPPPLTAPASGAAGMSDETKKKLLIYGLLAAGAVALVVVARMLFKK